MKKLFSTFAALAACLFVSTACRDHTVASRTEPPANKTVFLAGATGVIGAPLGKALAEKGYTVYGTTRSADKTGALAAAGVKPVVVDVFDAPALAQAVAQAKPDVVINELSSLPKGLKESEMADGLKRDSKIRIKGTRHLIAAAEQAGVKKYITQSFMYYASGSKPVTEDGAWLEDTDPVYGESVRAVKSLEQQTLSGKFTSVILRYGWIYGGTSGFAAPPEGYAGIYIDAVVDATVRAVEADLNGVYNVAEDGSIADSGRFKRAVPEWRAK